MRDDSPAARKLFRSHVSSGEERRCRPDQAASLHAGYDSDSGDPRGSNFWCRRSASVRVATTALKSATILAMTPLGLFLGLALRAGFFLAASLFLAAVLDLFFAAVLRFVLRFFLVTAAGFFFAFAADFLRAFLAIASPPKLCRFAGMRLSGVLTLRQGLQQTQPDGICHHMGV